MLIAAADRVARRCGIDMEGVGASGRIAAHDGRRAESYDHLQCDALNPVLEPEVLEPSTPFNMTFLAPAFYLRFTPQS